MQDDSWLGVGSEDSGGKEVLSREAESCNYEIDCRKSQLWEPRGHMFLLLVFKLQLLNQRLGEGLGNRSCNSTSFREA